MSSGPASAIILAGGLATRLQGDKAGREVRGKTLLQTALDIAGAACDELIVASGARTFELPQGVKAVPDDTTHKGAGALAGIAAGLVAASHDKVLVLACDLPNVPAKLVQALLNALDKADCAYCRHDADEPLLAGLRRDAARTAVARAIECGRFKVIPVWQGLNPRVITGVQLRMFGAPAHVFSNVNTPEDLRREQGA
jgi:molybdopterin-guanine dinucleotide biosynthesis protein A